MSHIDSFRHELVGLLGGLPVYHPLEPMDGEIDCDPSQLLLGGGSGEHPALAIRSPAAAAACFLDTELRQWENDRRAARQAGVDVGKWRAVIDAHLDWSCERNLAFFDWSIDDYARFAELCRSPAMPNPYHDGDYGLEHWLILGFGEFVFFAMPELAPDIVDALDDPYRPFHHVRYSNVLLVPPNMPVYANGGNAFFTDRKR